MTSIPKLGDDSHPVHHAKPHPQTSEPKSKDSLKMGAVMFGNVFTLPTQLLSIASGGVAGGGAALLALIRGKPAGAAFCNRYKKTSNHASIALMLLTFPLEGISYGVVYAALRIKESALLNMHLLSSNTSRWINIFETKKTVAPTVPKRESEIQAIKDKFNYLDIKVAEGEITDLEMAVQPLLDHARGHEQQYPGSRDLDFFDDRINQVMDIYDNVEAIGDKEKLIQQIKVSFNLLDFQIALGKVEDLDKALAPLEELKKDFEEEYPGDNGLDFIEDRIAIARENYAKTESEDENI